MPVISAFADHPTRPYVRVETNWADVPSVTHARVLRVNTTTGECAPLRPYVCFEGDYILLSCGHAIFWDTEAPLDTPVYYITEGLGSPCIPPDPLQPCIPCVPTTATSGTVTVAANGTFWLKDPVRPCNDRPVPLCATDSQRTADCGGGTGITFVGIGTELYNNNSIRLRPTNRRRPLAVTRQRADASTALRLQTISFDDREDLLQLLIPGSPLLFQGPPGYGVPDRYMDIGPAQIDPAMPDLRVQIRSAVLPYETVDRPAGPTQGICGTRVQDICEVYTTWEQMQTAGLAWEDLIRGRAAASPPFTDLRTWNDVQAEFVDWDAVNTGGRTWDGLEAGL